MAAGMVAQRPGSVPIDPLGDYGPNNEQEVSNF
jgi:hypothetical protein